MFTDKRPLDILFFEGGGFIKRTKSVSPFDKTKQNFLGGNYYKEDETNDYLVLNTGSIIPKGKIAKQLFSVDAPSYTVYLEPTENPYYLTPGTPEYKPIDVWRFIKQPVYDPKELADERLKQQIGSAIMEQVFHWFENWYTHLPSVSQIPRQAFMETELYYNLNSIREEFNRVTFGNPSSHTNAFVDLEHSISIRGQPSISYGQVINADERLVFFHNSATGERFYYDRLYDVFSHEVDMRTTLMDNITNEIRNSVPRYGDYARLNAEFSVNWMELDGVIGRSARGLQSFYDVYSDFSQRFRGVASVVERSYGTLINTINGGGRYLDAYLTDARAANYQLLSDAASNIARDVGPPIAGALIPETSILNVPVVREGINGIGDGYTLINEGVEALPSTIAGRIRDRVGAYFDSILPTRVSNAYWADRLSMRVRFGGGSLTTFTEGVARMLARNTVASGIMQGINFARKWSNVIGAVGMVGLLLYETFKPKTEYEKGHPYNQHDIFYSGWIDPNGVFDTAVSSFENNDAAQFQNQLKKNGGGLNNSANIDLIADFATAKQVDLTKFYWQAEQKIEYDNIWEKGGSLFLEKDGAGKGSLGDDVTEQWYSNPDNMIEIKYSTYDKLKKAGAGDDFLYRFKVQYDSIPKITAQQLIDNIKLETNPGLVRLDPEASLTITETDAEKLKKIGFANFNPLQLNVIQNTTSIIRPTLSEAETREYYAEQGFGDIRLNGDFFEVGYSITWGDSYTTGDLATYFKSEGLNESDFFFTDTGINFRRTDKITDQMLMDDLTKNGYTDFKIEGNNIVFNNKTVINTPIKWIPPAPQGDKGIINIVPIPPINPSIFF